MTEAVGPKPIYSARGLSLNLKIASMASDLMESIRATREDPALTPPERRLMAATLGICALEIRAAERELKARRAK